VVDHYDDRIGEYDATIGAAINANLVTGLGDPIGIAFGPSSVPEPSSFLLVGLIVAVGLCRWRLSLWRNGDTSAVG
jgi:PEP-CTERM motif